MGTVVRTRVALLVVDVEFLEVLLVLGAEVFVVDAPAPMKEGLEGRGGRES